jgi:hypothetical protein
MYNGYVANSPTSDAGKKRIGAPSHEITRIPIYYVRMSHATGGDLGQRMRSQVSCGTTDRWKPNTKYAPRRQLPSAGRFCRSLLLWPTLVCFFTVLNMASILVVGDRQLANGAEHGLSNLLCSTLLLVNANAVLEELPTTHVTNNGLRRRHRGGGSQGCKVENPFLQENDLNYKGE